MAGPLRGALAAAVTPLRAAGSRLDEDAFAPYARFLADGGIDGVLALGTTGEGILLRPDERRRALELLLAGVEGRVPVIAHCGAQTTAETVVLAGHAAVAGAAAVAVIAPPYYLLDEREQLAHLAAAAAACAPLPFYAYEFAARSGYAVTPATVARLRDLAPNLVGIKVSDSPASAVAAYLQEGLDVFAGSEVLLPELPGCAGTVSGLGAVFPEVVAAVVARPTPEVLAQAAALRGLVSGRFVATAKAALGLRGLPVRPDTRPPVRPLDDAELALLRAALARLGY